MNGQSGSWRESECDCMALSWRDERNMKNCSIEYRRYFLHLATELKADEICRIITPTTAFADILSAFKDFETEQKQQAKFDMEHVVRQDKKKQQAVWDERLADIFAAITVAKEAVWLYEKFGDGVYADVLGLCKVADITEIEDKGWSLTPGAYVGVAPVEDDGIDFAQRMAEIHRELLSLQAESNDLMDTISKNIKEMGL